MAIIPTSLVQGVSYEAFLAQTEGAPFRVGKTVIISSSTGQLDQPVTITTREATGKRIDHVFTPSPDPYQNLTNTVVDYYEYDFGGYSQISFNQINGSATVVVKLFPLNLEPIIYDKDGVPKPRRKFLDPYVFQLVNNGSSASTGDTVGNSFDNRTSVGIGYTTYLALVSQTGTNSPTAIVLINTLGEEPTWSRAGVGNYLLTSASGLFTSSKTAIYAVSIPGNNFFVSTQQNSSSQIAYRTTNIPTTPIDGILSKSAVRIDIFQ